MTLERFFLYWMGFRGSASLCLGVAFSSLTCLVVTERRKGHMLNNEKKLATKNPPSCTQCNS